MRESGRNGDRVLATRLGGHVLCYGGRTEAGSVAISGRYGWIGRVEDIPGILSPVRARRRVCECDRSAIAKKIQLDQLRRRSLRVNLIRGHERGPTSSRAARLMPRSQDRTVFDFGVRLFIDLHFDSSRRILARVRDC